MSISPNVGAWSGYLKRIIDGQAYTLFVRDVQAVLKGIPGIGDQVLKATRNLADAVKTFFVPGKLLEELGLQYVGPINGHSILSRGGAEGGEEEIRPGAGACGHPQGEVVARRRRRSRTSGTAPPRSSSRRAWALGGDRHPSYTSIFAQTLTELGRSDPKILAISAAMLSGTGLDIFKEAL